MIVHDGRDLLDQVKGRNDRCAFQARGGYVVREWDDSLHRVSIVQVHGGTWSRFRKGVTFQYKDGLQHRVSLPYFLSLIVAIWMPSTYAFMDGYTARMRGPHVIRLDPPSSLPIYHGCAICGAIEEGSGECPRCGSI